MGTLASITMKTLLPLFLCLLLIPIVESADNATIERGVLEMLITMGGPKEPTSEEAHLASIKVSQSIEGIDTDELLDAYTDFYFALKATSEFTKPDAASDYPKNQVPKE